MKHEMDKKKLLIYINAALYSLWALLTVVSVVVTYRTGAAYRAQGHPEVWIFTREMVMKLFRKYLPLLLGAMIMTMICKAKGICDERQDKPVVYPEIIKIYKSERETVRNKAAETANEKRIRITRSVMLAVAVVFVIAGILNGSLIDMLIKAINICTECIGLG